MTTDLIESYAQHHYAYNAISYDRKRQQPKVLLALADHAGKQLDEVTGRDVRDYLATRLAEGIAPTTLGKHLSMIRPFFTWMYAEGHIDAERLLQIREVKPPRGANAGEPRPYSDKEITRFWKAVEKAYPWTTRGDGSLELALSYVERWKAGRSGWARVAPYAARLQVEAVIALAMYGGLRQDEIYRLQIELMHPDNAYVVVMGARKNAAGVHPTRPVPWVVDDMREAVRAWLDFREVIDARMGVPHDRPWLTLDRVDFATNPMTKRKFSLLVCSAGAGWQFHRLRHTAATEMLRAGYELEKVQKIMGHATIQQTLRYAKLMTDDVLKTARRSESNYAARMKRLREAAGGDA